MKNLVKKSLKTIAGLVVGVCVGIGIGSELVTEPVAQVAEENKIEVTMTWYQEGNVQELDGYYLEDGDMLVELSNGSWAISNHKNNYYVFQAVELGDWDYQVESPKQLENIIKTYLSMKNNGWY